MSASKSTLTCKYACNVGCAYDGSRCDKCGWNPEVAARRLEKIYEKMGAKA